MATREHAPTGAPCWIDLYTSDPAVSRPFYEQLFGWSSDVAEEFGGYINFTKDGRPVAGGMQNDGTSGSPDVWSVYLCVDDAEASVQAITDAGGQLYSPPMDVGDLGRMAVAADVGGAAIGIWQPGLHQGFTVMAEPSAPSWFELHTRSYDASVDFYRDVFGFDIHVMSDAEDFRYSTAGEGDDALAGIMDASEFLAEGVPSHWTIYFGVDDADETVARTQELGGSVVHEPHDTPHGRLAVLTDPTGATFRIVQGWRARLCP